MKDIKKIRLIFFGLILLSSCAKENQINLTNVVEPADIKLQDSIDKYPPLISYIDSGSMFQLGAGTSLSDYVDQGRMYQLIKNNFNAITLGYAMKHGAVVQPDGSLDLTNIEKLLSLAKKDGIFVYGHTLVWHANQNASYLNGLIAPMIVKMPPYPNSLDVSELKNGTLSGGWSSKGNGEISIEDNNGLSANSKVIKLVASQDASAPEDLQLITPDIPVNPSHTYKVVFYIKSVDSGEGGITFEGLNNNKPQIDLAGTGKTSGTFTTDFLWKKISFDISGFLGPSVKLHLNFGNKPDVTYYIDVNSFYIYDTQLAPVATNLIQNGDFENGNSFFGWGNGSTRGTTADGLGLNGQGHAFYVTNPSKANSWEAQAAYDVSKPLEKGATYNASFWIKGTVDGTISLDMQTSSNYSSNSFGSINVTTKWQHVTLSMTASTNDRNRLIFNLGSFVGTVYLDDVNLSNAAGEAEKVITVEKTSKEKRQIIENAMDNWISGIVSNTPYIKAWDVVNEPMSDGNPYELKTGMGKSLNTDEFYWQDYLGKDYGVIAFKLARKYSKGNAILFINDYNLGYNLDKCRGLIAYVKYIESHGAKVDGIGTQMHIDVNSDKDKIEKMFKLLSATGKLIRISELDIGLGNGITIDNASPELYEKQAEMYKYVVDKYFEIIPKDQRYGITVWSPLDSPKSSSWRAGEPIGLWNLDYIRKKAYVGFATGLNEAFNK